MICGLFSSFASEVSRQESCWMNFFMWLAFLILVVTPWSSITTFPFLLNYKVLQSTGMQVPGFLSFSLSRAFLRTIPCWPSRVSLKVCFERVCARMIRFPRSTTCPRTQKPAQGICMVVCTSYVFDFRVELLKIEQPSFNTCRWRHTPCAQHSNQ